MLAAPRPSALMNIRLVLFMSSPSVAHVSIESEVSPPAGPGQAGRHQEHSCARPAWIEESDHRSSFEPGQAEIAPINTQGAYFIPATGNLTDIAPYCQGLSVPSPCGQRPAGSTGVHCPPPASGAEPPDPLQRHAVTILHGGSADAVTGFHACRAGPIRPNDKQTTFLDNSNVPAKLDSL